MSSLAKTLLLIVVILGIGAGLVLWQTKFAHHGTDFSIAKQEMEVFIADFNPMQLNALSSKPEEKQRLIKNLKETLSLASAAEKAGIGSDPVLKTEIKNMGNAVLAFNYDKEIHKDDGPMPPFGFVSEDQIKAFWGDIPEAEDESWLKKQYNKVSWIWGQRNSRWNESEFQTFLDTKIALARKRGQLPAGQEPSEQDITAARDSFARTRITYFDAKAKLKSIPEMTDEKEKKRWGDFETRVGVQTKLQIAQLLSSTYVQDVLSKQLTVKEPEIKAYIAEHPELTKSAEKENTAKEVLGKIKEGGDFAELAKEYSEDPGSKTRGGLYEGVVKGQFAPEFEAAVNGLEPGEVAPDIVKTSFGFHIIKLEKRGEAKGANGATQQTYDARHILISTMVKDPENPAAREMPVEQYVKGKLEKERQEEALAKVLKDNPVAVPEDFEIPKANEEEMKKMQEQQMQQMRQQMQRQQGAQPPRPAPPRPQSAPPAPKK